MSHTPYCQIEVYACLFILHFLPSWTHLIGACTISILGSNATLHVNWAYCGVSSLVLAVDMLKLCKKIIHVCSITTASLVQVFVFGEKSLPCTFFLPCTYINFQTMGHPRLVFRPAHNEFSDNVPPYTCVCPTTCIWQFRVYASVNWVIIGSGNGLLPLRRQAIVWINAGILSIRSFGTNFGEILIKIQNFSFTKMHLKILSGKWCPFCLGGDLSHFQAYFSDKWLRYHLSNCPQVNVTGPYWW